MPVASKRRAPVKKPPPKKTKAPAKKAPAKKVAAKKAPPKREKVAPGDAIAALDYVDRAIEYAKSAALLANKDQFGRWMKLACARFLSDLERAKEPGAPFVFSRFEANNPCDFIEKLPHVEGKWPTKTILLHESDIFFIVNLFGFRRHDGTRRFTTALKAIARKNAKSTVAATIGLYCEACEGENGPQVISAATTGSQARIVFNIAKAMVERTEALREAFQMEAYANAIPCYSNAGTFKPINSKASTQDGLNPSCTIVDEVHAHKDHSLINVLRSAAGARDNPLFLFTTTEGYEGLNGPWAELRHFAKQLLLGVVEADHFLVCYYALDEEDKTAGIKADGDFDESKWEKANPLMAVNPLLLKEMRKEAIEARQMPGRLAEFRIKRLNRPAASAGGWINLVKWRENKGAVDLDFLKTKPCYGGLDLSSTSDLTSFRLTWFVGDKIYTHGWRFVTTTAIQNREGRALVPYRLWVERGYLIEAGHEVIDYDRVYDTILDAHKGFDIRMIGYDPWNAKQITAKLKDDGVPMVEFVQGPKSYHPAMQTLERAYTSGNLVFGEDPVLNWCASNLIARRDKNTNMAPDKARAPEKIDDMTALLESIGVSINEEEPEADAEEFFRNPIVITR